MKSVGHFEAKFYGHPNRVAVYLNKSSLDEMDPDWQSVSDDCPVVVSGSL